MADIVPRVRRAERRPTAVVSGELDELRRLALELRAGSNAADFDTGLTTDDMLPAR
jgi:hypothetical protein